MRSRRPPHPLVCGVLVAAADISLRVTGLRRSVRLARRLAGNRAGAETESARAIIGETARRVATAAAFYPGRAQCLEQSLALYLLLRRRGIAAELRIGVQPFPFTAHAWVEYQGRAVNEVEDFVATLTPFPTLGG